jgi:RHS repeat-associated protein
MKFGHVLVGLSAVIALASCGDDADPALATTHRQQELVLDNTYPVPVEADSTIRRDLANNADGTATRLVLAKDARGRVLVRVNKSLMQAVVGLGTLNKAWIEIGIRGADGRTPLAGETLSAHRLTAAFSENAATWNCSTDSATGNNVPDCSGATDWSMEVSPPFVGAASGSAAVTPTTSGLVRIEVTADVAAILAGTVTNHGWIVKKTDETLAGRYELYSRESSILMPRLLIALNPGPPPPSSGDLDGDGLINAIDPCPNDRWNDADLDTVCGNIDNCAAVPNPLQIDADTDALGDPCDLDRDGDGYRVDENDCNDTTSTFSPIADEICGDVLDQDCDGADERCPPVDPATIAPALDQLTPSTMEESVSFLYTGVDPIQAGVVPGTIDPDRVALIRGRVLDINDDPLPSVEVDVPDMPELGSTVTRADGRFDLVVNAHRSIVMRFHKNRFLDVQRTYLAPAQDFRDVDDIVMTPFDAAVTSVDLAAMTEVVVHQATSVTDGEGTRQAKMLFTPGMTATMFFEDGTSAPLESLSVRATEFTIGDNGPNAMPATLPPTSAYTYAADLNIDEALAAGAEHVDFSTPVVFYVDNFLEMPVGTLVPVGNYDEAAKEWVSTEHGNVIKVISVTSGLADLDITGDGVADTGAVLTDLGITSAERAALASEYSVGAEIWRARMDHFCRRDLNFTRPRRGDDPDSDIEDDEDICPSTCDGSLIEIENRVLTESIPIAGTPFALSYSSRAVDGRKKKVNFRLTPATLPADLQSVTLDVQIAGQRHTYAFPTPTANLTQSFVWDGLDVFGRRVQGARRLTATVTYFYPGSYAICQYGSGDDVSFGAAPTEDCGSTSESTPLETRPFTTSKTLSAKLGGLDPIPLGFGGWSLDVHHRFDRLGGRVQLGTGRAIETPDFDVVHLFAGDGTSCTDAACAGDGAPAELAQVRVEDIAAGPDGSVFLMQPATSLRAGRIRQVARDGTISTFAGGGADTGEGVQATAASVSPVALAAASDGTVYFVDKPPLVHAQLRRIRDGVVTTIAGIAGTPAGCPSGDGGPAASAVLGTTFPRLSVGVDSIYFVDNYCAPSGGLRVRRIGTDGVIHAYAGFGTTAPADGVAAIDLQSGIAEVAPMPDGSVLIAYSLASAHNATVWRVGTDGLLARFAGSGVDYWTGDDGPAISAGIGNVKSLAVGPRGDVLIGETCHNPDPGTICGCPRAFRRVDQSGVITTYAGVAFDSCGPDEPPYLFPGLPITAGELDTSDLRITSIGDDGRVFTRSEEFGLGHVVFDLGSVVPRDDQVIEVPGAGGEVYVFDGRGRHQRTIDSLTRAELFRFTTNAAGLLLAIVDGDGNTTLIERDAADEPIAIIGPYGHRTDLALSGGLLTEVSDPNGNAFALGYSTSGALLTSFEDPRGNASTLTYDSDGRLSVDEDAAGGSKTLTATTVDGELSIEVETADGRSTTYSVGPDEEGAQQRATEHPSGLVTSRARGRDGVTQSTAPDGTTITVAFAPDPRYGMMKPFVTRRTVTTPSNLVRNEIRERTSIFQDVPGQGPTLVSQTDTLSVNSAGDSERVYDATAGTISFESAAARTVVAQLDAKGRAIQVTKPSVAPLNITYDANGRVSVLTQATQGGEEQRTEFIYGPDGNVSTIIDPLERTTTFTYDAAGRPTSATLPGARVIALGFDDGSNLTSVTPPSQPLHELDYTPVNLVAEYTPPDVLPGSDTTSYDYSLDRDLELITLPDSDTIDPSYDSAGRSSSIAFSGKTVSFTYDATSGRLTSIAGPGTEGLAFTYDGPLQLSTTWSGTVTGSVENVFNAKHLAVTKKVNGASPLAHFYDLDELLVDAGPLKITRNNLSGLLEWTRIGGVRTTYTHDAFGSVASISDPGFSLTFTRDKLARITRVVDVLGSTTTTEYEYAEGGWLEQVTTNGVVTAEYTYDGNGNRVSGPSPSTTYTIDDQDRLLTAGTLGFTYTAQGSLATMTDTATSDVTTYDYDTLGNLLSVELPNGDVIEYVIDGLGRRVGKIINGTLERGWLYDGQLRIVAELDAANSVVARFVYGTKVNVPELMIVGGVNYKILTDHVGSVRRVVNPLTGVAVQELAYDEFGNVLIDTNPAFQPFGFAGGLYDGDTGLVRFGARDYQALTGRWTAKDPIRFSGSGTNLYAYAANDPINFLDPDGKVVVPAIALAGAALVAFWWLSDSPLGCDGGDHYRRNLWQAGHCPRQLDLCSTEEFYLYQEDPVLHGSWFGAGAYDVRGMPGSPMAGTQCIYDAGGNLVTDRRWAGSFDYSEPLATPLDHVIDDVLPWLPCGNGPAYIDGI